MARKKVAGKNILLLNFTYIIMSSKNGIPLKKAASSACNSNSCKSSFP